VKRLIHEGFGFKITPAKTDEPSSISQDVEMSDHGLPEPPNTPKIQVDAPPDENEIHYIGVGLGTLSNQDKKIRRQQTAPPNLEPSGSQTLRSPSSMESIHTEELSSGQLTPAAHMVYLSPSMTTENIFENAFKEQEDQILTQDEKAQIYDTWRTEELRGEPISNQHGRAKVELERDDGGLPRWEKLLKDKMPHKLTEIFEGLQERKAGENKSVKSKFGAVAQSLMSGLGSHEKGKDNF
jgi:hypothetical protein